MRRRSPDLNLNLGANLSWARNEVSKYIGTPTYPLSNPVGHHVNEAWGLKSAGFFQESGRHRCQLSSEYSTVSPGDIKYQDLNGDQVINEFDVTSLDGAIRSLNSTMPSMSVLEYKGFGLNAWFQGTGNYMKYLPSAIWGGMADNGNLQWTTTTTAGMWLATTLLPTSDNSEQQQQQPGKQRMVQTCPLLEDA